jgi:hypothetical protein
MCGEKTNYTEDRVAEQVFSVGGARPGGPRGATRVRRLAFSASPATNYRGMGSDEV